jgi:hypothetical protein
MLKNRLRKIKTNCDSVHLDGSSRWLTNLINGQSGTLMPSGAVHPALRAKRSNLPVTREIASSLCSSQ